MSSEAITRNDLKAVLDEVLPAEPSEYKKLLWTNSQGAQTSYSFSADFSKYDELEVQFARNNCIHTFKMPTSGSANFIVSYDGYFTYRNANISGSTFTFNNGGYFATYNNGTVTYGASYCVPYKVYGIKYERIAPPQIEYPTYSTEEQQVGTWVTGKPLYRKVFQYASMPNNTTAVYAHNISNMDIVVRYTCCWWDSSDGRFLMHPRNDSSTVKIQCSINKTNIVLEAVGTNWSTRTSNVNVIVEYTKTTD